MPCAGQRLSLCKSSKCCRVKVLCGNTLRSSSVRCWSRLDFDNGSQNAKTAPAGSTSAHSAIVGWQNSVRNGTTGLNSLRNTSMCKSAKYSLDRNNPRMPCRVSREAAQHKDGAKGRTVPR